MEPRLHRRHFEFNHTESEFKSLYPTSADGSITLNCRSKSKRLFLVKLDSDDDYDGQYQYLPIITIKSAAKDPRGPKLGGTSPKEAQRYLEGGK